MNYGTVIRRSFKIRHGLFKTGLTQDHHVIPKEFRNHSMVKKANYNINESKNIVIMPTRLGKKTLKLREDRLIHENGHPEYNKFVAKYLDCIDDVDEFEKFVEFLKISCRYRPQDILW